MKYSKGWKYRLENPLYYKLHFDYNVKEDYQGDYYVITKSGWLILLAGYCWNGATKFPDFKWILPGSAIHDALHQCINEGIISTEYNDLIDEELAKAIKGFPGASALMKLRAFYVRKGTNLVDEKATNNYVKVLETPKLPNEKTYEEYITSNYFCFDDADKLRGA